MANKNRGRYANPHIGFSSDGPDGARGRHHRVTQGRIGNQRSISQLRARHGRSIFASAGFGLESCERAKNCVRWADRVIVAHLDRKPPDTFPRQRWPSQAFQGRNVRVYLHRLKAAAGPSRRVARLAHVMVHEITHLLHAGDHHTHSGVMRARWDSADFRAMEKARLPFTGADIDPIRAGLAKRSCWPRELTESYCRPERPT